MNKIYIQFIDSIYTINIQYRYIVYLLYIACNLSNINRQYLYYYSILVNPLLIFYAIKCFLSIRPGFHLQ